MHFTYFQKLTPLNRKALFISIVEKKVQFAKVFL